MIKGILFDMDGVLVDTESISEEATRKVMKKLFDISVSDKVLYMLKGIRDLEHMEIFHSMLHVKCDPKLYLQEKNGLYLTALMDKNLAFPATHNILKELKQYYKFGLATSSDSKKFAMTSKWFDVNIFDEIILGDDVKYGKPNPECYLKVMKKLKLEPKDCVVIEDSTHGIKAAKAAGAKCIAVLGTFPEEDLLAAGADIIIPNIKDLNRKVIARVEQIKVG